MLKAIFFDIDDTLFSTTWFAEKARNAAVAAMIKAGLRADHSECMRELEEVLVEFTSNYPGHFDRLLQRLPGEATEGLNKAILIAAGVVAYHDTKWRELRIYEDAGLILTWLSGTALLRGIISAGLDVKQAEKIIHLGIYEHLSPNAIYFTDQIGISKPNPKLYLRVLEEHGLQPDEAIYVGDRPEHDIDPANEVGMITVRSRRGGRHAEEVGRTDPDHEINDFQQLREILEEDYGVKGK